MDAVQQAQQQMAQYAPKGFGQQVQGGQSMLPYSQMNGLQLPGAGQQQGSLMGAGVQNFSNLFNSLYGQLPQPGQQQDPNAAQGQAPAFGAQGFDASSIEQILQQLLQGMGT